MKHVSLAVFNYNNQKLCDIYDSFSQAKGQAYDITFTQELSGWKEVSFTLPFIVDNEDNFRWDYIKNEYKLRLRIGSFEDWFLIQAPKLSKNGRAITDVVKCPHESTILKTKNIYLTFDDENGIDTIGNLVPKILANTGWSLGLCDTFYESDGHTEKIRSLVCEGKAGSYKLITDVCNLFKGYPTYNGATKTVDIHAMSNKNGYSEMTLGRNLDSLVVDYNSENIVTRLYVEGEYGDFGYVGIDDVNPTGLTYILNFDYYRSIGVFTSAQETALQEYLTDMPAINTQIKTATASMNTAETELNTLMGQCSYVFYWLTNGTVTKSILRGNATDADKTFVAGDKITVLKATGPYRVVIANSSGVVAFESDDVYAFKFKTKPSGLVGSKEVAIEAKEKMIASIGRKIAELQQQIIDHPEQTEELERQIQELQSQIAGYNAEISAIYNGSATSESLYTEMHRAAYLLNQITNIRTSLVSLTNQQSVIEYDFSVAMGDFLRDGYWSDTNYTVGQEQNLYNDAVDLLAQISKPSVTYSISEIKLSEAMGFEIEPYEQNSVIHLYDPDLKINDLVYVSKRVHYLDDPTKDTVEISNQDITLTGQGFDSVLSRITQQADLVNQKNALFSRAKAINGNGSIYMERLEGTIDILKNRLLSSSSSWYTDDSGNIIFESVTGKSAMMLTGEGFMIAAGKTPDGEWNWRTFGTGEGFTADAIITGYLSADRIEAGSITTNKLASEVGSELDLSSNTSINLTVETISGEVFDDKYGEKVVISATEPQNPTDGMIWIQPRVDGADVWRRWDDTADEWVECTIPQADINAMNGSITRNTSSITQMSDQITSKVSTETYNTGLASKADTSWVTQRLETIISQTATDIEFSFNEAKQYTLDVNGSFTDFIEEVRSYQRFTADGLELGMSNSPFIAKQGNTRLSFLQNGVEIAYISNNKLYITEAQVKNKLLMGVEDNGLFEWVVLDSGQALRWRG